MNQVKKCRHGDMVHLTNDTYIGRSFDLYGEFSEGEVALFRELVKPGQTVLDIGANIGALTVPLAQLAGLGGRVLAFEPQRIPFYCLCANVVLNNLTNVVCHQTAVAEAAGTRSVPELDYLAEANFGSLELTSDYRHHRTYPVPVLKIDDLRLDDCHIMKIDVEGMEKEVLAGAADTIRRFRPILYVEDDRPDKSPGLRAFLESLGYELYEHQPPLYNPQNFFHNPQNIFPRIASLNLYCHPRDVISPVNPADFPLTKVRQEPLVFSLHNNRPDRYNALTLGLQYHRAGHLHQAEQLYRQVLETDPANADALNYLGGAYLAQGRLDEAVAAFQQVLQLRPHSVELQNDLGVVLAQQGKLDQAVACFRQALQSRPDYAEAYNNLGIVLSQQGKLAEAVRCYQQALRIKANYAEAHSNLGLALASLGKLPEAIARQQQALEIKPDFTGAANNLRAALAAQERLNQDMADFRMSHWYLPDDPAAYSELGLALKTQGRLTEAIASFQEALRLRTDFAPAHNNLGVTFKERGNADEAVASLRQALALNPDFVEAYNNLGTILESAGNLDEASACYHQALCRKPDFAEAHNNLGIVLNKQGKYAEALAHYQQALKLKPDYPDAHHNLGTVLVDQGKLNEALLSYERALQLNPDYVEPHLGRAQAWLQMGDWERGWPEFEWRWRRKSFPPRSFHQPLWDGGSLAGRTILLHAEQGLGDTLQFIRYAPLVKQRGHPLVPKLQFGNEGQFGKEGVGLVIVECQEALLPLLATCPGIDRLVATGSALPHFDTHAPLVSLPGILRTSLATVPADVPYLSADPELVKSWRQALAAIQAFKIGIAWQGNPGHTNDRQRSVPLVSFEPLARLDGVHLLSLQKGPGTEQLATAMERFSLPDLGSQFQTFQDTAAVLKNLDLVITVDSAVAHCAGALAVPVWVLVPYAADWRWLLDREDSPWYPTMRLFRQKEPGNWDDVFKRIMEEVQKLLAPPVGRGQ